MSDLTRAEAINELTEHLNHWKRLLKEGICGKEQGERTIKSLEFAIDSLKTDSTIKEAYKQGYKDGQKALAYHLELCKEEAEPCEDCISRKAMYEQIHCWIGSGEYRYTNATDYLTKRVADLPSIQPKQKTDVFDKIRAEIKEVQTYKMFEGEDTVYVERNDVFKIIGKYKAEKE